jgi:2-methylcitrate dehydratase PrpD
MTQVEALAKYAARASFTDLSTESRRQLPIHILDSLVCCIAAPGAAPIQACREQVAEFGGTGPCALIGGEQANPIYAAFWHTALVRYVDFMDNFLAPDRNLPHGGQFRRGVDDRRLHGRQRPRPHACGGADPPAVQIAPG